MRSALHSWRQRLRVPGKPEIPRPGGTWTGLRGARASPRENLGVLYAHLRSEAWPGYRLDGLRSNQLAAPLGLLAKKREWYLAWENDRKLRCQR